MSGQHDTAREGRIEAHRLDGFIDAVFAFAVSVLAIAGAEIPHSLHDLMVALSRIPAFACSFATLMLFWHRHVQWRDRFRTHDAASIVPSGGTWSVVPGCLYALLTAVYWITGSWSRRALARAA